MTRQGDRLICGISGGPDSVCLVYVLANLQKTLGIDMILAHVNYHTRAEDSDLDAALCRKIAQNLSLPIYVRSVDSDELSSMKNENFQREARKLRFAFFEQLCYEHDANKIAIGHTADDSVETTIMHFLRGSGVAGLGGIYPTSGKTIRPLIDCSRQEIISYLDDNDIEFRIDKSNLGNDYLRNHVRNDLIPYLEKEFSPQLRQVLHRTSRLARKTNEFIASHVDRLWERAVKPSRMGKVCISLSEYFEADEMVRYGLLRKAHRTLIASDRPHKSLDLELVENADRLREQPVGTRADLNNRVMIERGDKHLILFLDDEVRVGEEIAIPGDNEIDGFCLDISSSIEDIGSENVEDADNYAVQIDFETISAPYAVRTIEEGDRVRLLNAPGSRKVSDILADKKVPRSLRGEVPILTASGRIVWIVGIGIADEVKITERTGKVLKLSARARVIQDGDEQER